MTLSDGLHQLSREEYEQLDRVNWSTLKHLARSPAHYRQELLQWDHDTTAKQRGRVVHLAVFEPERFRNSVAVWDLGVRRGKDWERFKERNQGRELLTAAEYEQATAIGEAVRKCEMAARWLNKGRAEVAILWTSRPVECGDIPCKGRVDFIAEAGAIVDLKTTRNAAPEAFGRQCWSLQYLGQAAFYVDGHEAATGKRLPYVIAAVEPEPPYVVQVYRVPDYLLSSGRDLYRSLLYKLNECRKANSWPGYAEGELELEVPRWALPPEDEDAAGLGIEIKEAV